MKRACCALHPDCTAKDFCNEVLKKLGAEDKGSSILSAWVFDRAKRAFIERLQEASPELLTSSSVQECNIYNVNVIGTTQIAELIEVCRVCKIKPKQCPIKQQLVYQFSDGAEHAYNLAARYEEEAWSCIGWKCEDCQLEGTIYWEGIIHQYETEIGKGERHNITFEFKQETGVEKIEP